jgi:hypothetical protein
METGHSLGAVVRRRRLATGERRELPRRFQRVLVCVLLTPTDATLLKKEGDDEEESRVEHVPSTRRRRQGSPAELQLRKGLSLGLPNADRSTTGTNSNYKSKLAGIQTQNTNSNCKNTRSFAGQVVVGMSPFRNASRPTQPRGHTYSHTQKRESTQGTHTHTPTHPQTHTHTRASRTHTHPHTHTRTRTHTHAHTHTATHPHRPMHPHPPTHTPTHGHTHTHTHAYTHAHTHTRTRWSTHRRIPIHPLCNLLFTCTGGDASTDARTLLKLIGDP